jgi:hypothetical protein
VEKSNSMSFPSHAARAVTLPGATRQRLIGVTSAVSGVTGTAFRNTDAASPGPSVWSPPPA